jgi:hypothetical protein
MYAGDNMDKTPHPTWGTCDGSANDGPDGWAYATENRGRIAGAPAWMPSAGGQPLNSAAFSNQVAFFKVSQLGPFINDYHVLWCPKDVAQRGGSPYKRWFLARYVKLSSYCWNGTVGGYCGPRAGAIASGKTFPMSSFRPLDIIMWEQNEADDTGFMFNDLGNNPETAGEIISQRHAGGASYRGVAANQVQGGGAMVGRISGTAEFIKLSKFLDFIKPNSIRPNDVLNGPGFGGP